MLSKEVFDSLRPGLFAGQYNLLLGSGISLDSFDKSGKALKSASSLTRDLCKLKGVKDGTPLSRVSLLLNEQEIDKYLTSPYSQCRAGSTVRLLTSFVWRTIFTFNIDDALEAAYKEVARPKQAADSLNYDTTYRRPKNRSDLPIVHLHGFTRESQKGYVFSTTEYGRVTRGLNPWMHVLSELIASEPFIIAGTGLNEPDLEYYLGGRTETSARQNRGPSFLVEPYPDKITEKLCERHGLVLVTATLADFLVELQQTFGTAPTVAQITIPSLTGIFSEKVSASKQVAFFSSFELVKPATTISEGEISPFFYGQPPRWSDLESSLDVPTADERELTAKATNALGSGDRKRAILCVVSATGSGRTTELKRCAYTLAKEGNLVFYYRPNEPFDSAVVREVLSSLSRPAVLLVDGLADHTNAVRDLFLNYGGEANCLIIASDRDYRQGHINRVLGDLSIEYLTIHPWKLETYESLVEKLRKAGLLADQGALRAPAYFARQLMGDVVAIGLCRALKDFRPVENIVRSLWKDSSAEQCRTYSITALVDRCFDGGIFYPVLEKAGASNELRAQLHDVSALPLSFTEDGDYVVPRQAVVADRLLRMLSREMPDYLLEQFCSLGAALAPYVNRQTTIDRTPEARLASRLFNAESIVRPLLGDLAEQFYIKMHDSWKWNSRYWEQRALLIQNADIDEAIRFARHAVAIEAHPFPWTTLASLLSRKMESSWAYRDSLFNEICELLRNAMREETRRSWRPTPHPYATLFHATQVYIREKGTVAQSTRQWIVDGVEHCRQTFPRDIELNKAGSDCIKLLDVSNRAKEEGSP